MKTNFFKGFCECICWVSSRSHCKQFFGGINLESPLQKKNEIKKNPREKDVFKKQ